MSDIHGDGYGSAHNWKRGYTGYTRATEYQCGSCGANFRHAYDSIPNIFEAMKRCNVSEFCTVTRVHDEQGSQ